MSALSGLDIALWDLFSRRLNLPLHVLLGGAVRHKIRVYSWIGGDRPDDVYVYFSNSLLWFSILQPQCCV